MDDMRGTPRPPGWEGRLENILTADFQEYMRKWMPLSMIIGVTGGLISVAFQYLIYFVWDISYGSPLPWYILLFIPAIGGALVGLILTYFPEAQGFGTDEVIKAIHHRGGKMDWRLAPLALVSASLTIGSGGSAGRESPAALMGAGLASGIGERFNLKQSDMRIFLIAGTAACFSAVFKAPLGCAVFALELPYRSDMESNAAVPSLVSSVVGYLVSVIFFGTSPYLDMEEVSSFMDLTTLAFVLLVGLATGLVGIAFILFFRRFQELLAAMKVPFLAKVSLGGLLTGIIALSVPEILGLGEDTIEFFVNGGSYVIWALLALLLGKIAATVFTVGSGGSGGVFFPSLFMGGVVGAMVASAFQLPDPGLYVVVGMGAMMAGVTKAPVASPILITEMVAGYGTLIPVMIASTLAYIVTGNYSLYRGQMTRRTFSFDISTLGTVTVADIMRTPVVTIPEGVTATEALQASMEEPHYVYPVLNEKGRLRGQVYRDDIIRLHQEDPLAPLEDVIQNEHLRIPSDLEGLEAFEMMNRDRASRNLRLMVVEPWDRELLVGVVTRMDILQAMEELDERHR